MLNMLWPIALVVVSNTVYQICTKSAPAGMNPFATLTVTYAVGAVGSLILYYLLGGGSILHEYTKLNWAPFVLGLVIIGLEAGWIYAYKAGWQVSTAQIVQSAVLASILLIVGWKVYGESLTWKKITGMVVCLAGLGLINIE